MRKYLTREITKTTVKAVKTEIFNGEVVNNHLEYEVLVGNVTLEQAQKELTKKYGHGVVVVSVQASSQSYRMEVSQFIELAELVEEVEPISEQEKLETFI